jgi:hypothetical protein
MKPVKINCQSRDNTPVGQGYGKGSGRQGLD